LDKDRAVIVVNDNGPYMVTGPVVLQDPEGKPFPVKGDRFWLCRCGLSSTKPFCDGTHKRQGFESTCRA
jgi:CDGSH-type Zn-finger protein